jgi:hypothetical protein
MDGRHHACPARRDGLSLGVRGLVPAGLVGRLPARVPERERGHRGRCVRHPRRTVDTGRHAVRRARRVRRRPHVLPDRPDGRHAAAHPARQTRYQAGRRGRPGRSYALASWRPDPRGGAVRAGRTDDRHGDRRCRRAAVAAVQPVRRAGRAHVGRVRNADRLLRRHGVRGRPAAWGAVRHRPGARYHRARRADAVRAAQASATPARPSRPCRPRTRRSPPAPGSSPPADRGPRSRTPSPSPRRGRGAVRSPRWTGRRRAA